MENIDLAVVGGSFAGLSCAREAALNGLQTQLFERKTTPGSYTQSTGIFVKEIAEKMALPPSLSRKISGVRLYAPNMRYIDLASPDYYFVATDTQKVLAWMARQAESAGVEIKSHTQVQHVDEIAERIVLPEHDVSSAYLVAADGANSSLAKQLGLGQNTQCLSGAEYEVDGFDQLDDDKLHVFLSSRFAPGYIGWLLKGVASTQIGVAVKPNTAVKLKPFYDFLTSYFATSSRIIGGRGGLIPCGGVVSPWARDNVCLLGDAAGMVSPLTAGGIHPAIEVGEQLGQAIADHLLFNGVTPHQQVSSLVKRYPLKRRLRTLYNNVGVPDFVLNSTISNAVFQRAAQVIFFHHRGLFCAQAWREILSSKPAHIQ